MTDFRRESLAAAAGVDPWALRDRLTAGDPEEIYAMARGFNAAAAEQGHAVTLTTRGLETAGDGYRVNNATPVDVAAEVAQARADLGGGGEKLGSIARVLSGVASDLAQRTSAATTAVTTLEGEINGVVARYNTWVHNSAGIPADVASSVFTNYVNEAVQKVRDAGGPLRTSVDEYETGLSRALKSMADLGYIPPTALDEGPGDVDVPDARAAADGTVAATQEGSAAAARREFARNTAYLDLLNRKQRAGVALTEAERTWLSQYYERLTPHFGEIKDWADELVGVGPGEKPDQNDPVVQLVSRVGDGFLNLSRNVPYDELPQAARDVLAGNLGVTNPEDDQYRFYGRPGERHAEGWPPNGDQNLTEFAGFVGLLNDYSSDSVAPSDALASHLKDAALRWKQQINTMYANYQVDYELAEGYDTAGDKLSAEDWNRLFPDELSSDALGVTARNREFTNDWIVSNAEDRRTVMGANWQSGQGAADVLLSASLPGHGLPEADAARAGLVIVQDAATDYDGLAEMANTTVKGAIADVGLAYIDSFAQDEPGTPGVARIELPDGTTVPGFTLDDDTKHNFFKFVAASDPDIYQHFREGALVRGTHYLESVMAQGHTSPDDSAYQEALHDAVRLTSGTDGAAVAVIEDAVHENAGDDQVQKMREDLAYAQAMSDYNAKSGAVQGVKTIFSLAGLAPLPPGPGTALSVGSTGFDLITGAVLQAPPPPDQNRYITNLQQYVQNLADADVARAQADLNARSNLTTMIVNASANTGHPVIDPDTGRPVVPRADGMYPERVRADIYNSLDPYSAGLGADDIVNQLIVSGGASRPDGHGPGYNTQFGAEPSTAPSGVAELGDAGGNWSHHDDQYRIYYGDETRWRFNEPTTWEGASVSRDAPDRDPETETRAPVVPPAR